MFRMTRIDWTFSGTAEAVTGVLLLCAIVMVLVL
jgi:hypothetical protein